jgi:hypothetical protein
MKTMNSSNAYRFSSRCLAFVGTLVVLDILMKRAGWIVGSSVIAAAAT